MKFRTLLLLAFLILHHPAFAEEREVAQDSYSPVRVHITPASAEQTAPLLACINATSTPERIAGCTTAAEKGDREAQERLGDIYNYGLGISVDKSAALKWYKRAAEASPTRASVDFKLGTLYKENNSYRGLKTAIRYFRRAGGPHSDIALAHIFIEGGHGIQPNYTRAFSFAHAACAWAGAIKQTEWDEAISLKTEAAKHLTKEQIATAADFSELWDPLPGSEE